MSGLFGMAMGGLGRVLEGELPGGAQPEQAQGLMQSALGQAGGVSGLLDRAEQAGLGDKVRSWVGIGGNLPISPQEIAQIFPPEQLDAFAQQHGLPAGVVSQLLAHVLPHAVDAATPDGTAPANATAADAQDQDADASLSGSDTPSDR